MAQLYIGRFDGYANNSEYGAFNVYFEYSASGITLSNMKLVFKKTVYGKYTTNAYYIDSITIGGTSYSYSPTSGSAYYIEVDSGPVINISGTHASGSSVYIEVKCHRDGQSANGQTLSGTVTGLATAPTGLYCNVSSYTETKVTLSGGYTSNGGSSVTSQGYQYKTETGNWTTFNNGSTTLSPGTKYYFRYYATNAVGTTYTDGKANTTTYNYPSITSTPDFIIGNQLTIGIYNPLGRSVQVYIKGDNNSQAGGDTTTGTSIAGYNNNTWKSFWYASIPNKTGLDSNNKAQYKVRLICSALGRDTTVNGGYYKIKNDGSEVPTFDKDNWSYSANLTALTNNSQCIINGYSEITFSIDTAATSSYGASIIKYQFKWGSKSKYNDESYKVSGGNGNILEVAAIDSRQLSKATSKTLTSGSNYVPYTDPSLDYSRSYTHRTDGIGAETKLTLQGNLSVMKFGTNGVNNAIYSAKYRVWDYANNRWTNENGFTIPINSFSLQSSGYFSLNNYMIHSNGSSGGFEVGKRFGVQIILKDAQGLLGTLSSNLIPVTDGKIARDVYQDSNGDYHQGINGMGDDNYTEVIHGSLQVTDYADHFRPKSIIAYNGRQSSADFDHQYPQNKVSERLDIASGSMSTHKPPGGDGFIKTFFWDNSGAYDGQFAMSHTPNSLVKFGFRGRANETWGDWKSGLDLIYPVGSIYLSAVATSPANLFGGTWTQLKNRYLFATNATSGNKGKDALSSHTGTNVTGTAISVNQMPSHNHGGNTGYSTHSHDAYFKEARQTNSYNYSNDFARAQNTTDANYTKRITVGDNDGRHRHSITAQGGGATHDHGVSYIEVYVWQRTA